MCSWPAAARCRRSRAEQAAQEKQFAEDFKIASPDFQDEHGYPEAPYTDEVLTMGSPHITHAFGCLALTLELPFKDNANDPDRGDRLGWRAQCTAGRRGAAADPAGDPRAAECDSDVVAPDSAGTSVLTAPTRQRRERFRAGASSRQRRVDSTRTPRWLLFAACVGQNFISSSARTTTEVGVMVVSLSRPLAST